MLVTTAKQRNTQQLLNIITQRMWFMKHTQIEWLGIYFVHL